MKRPPCRLHTAIIRSPATSNLLTSILKVECKLHLFISASVISDFENVYSCVNMCLMSQRDKIFIKSFTYFCINLVGDITSVCETVL